MTIGGAQRAAEIAARDSYGRLLSILSSRTRDIAAAEDALSEAFANALRVWPKTGIPDNPDAWLLTAARRESGRSFRRSEVRQRSKERSELMYEEVSKQNHDTFKDERLKLLFICAHPAISEDIRTPLMMQTILGLDAATISQAFLIKPATLSQRLVRAKAKIRDAGIEYEVPDVSELPERLYDVLSSIYAAFSLGWDQIAGADAGSEALTSEAIFLAKLITALLPNEPEPKGLLALMLYIHAREPAQWGADNSYVPLSHQDPSLWDRDLIIAAEGELIAAAKMAKFGRFQTEAAIQSLHVQSAVTGRVVGSALCKLYDVLCQQSPTVGAFVGRAAAYGEHKTAEEGLEILDSLPADLTSAYQPYWAARFDLLLRRGETIAAKEAQERAIALASNQAVRDYLEAKG